MSNSTQFLNPLKFTLPMLKTVLQKLVQKGHHMIKIDLKDGFYHVPLNKKARPHFGIEYLNTSVKSQK